MAANPNEYQKETLRLALQLEPEYQLKLQQLEKEARSDPAMKAVYCILARQLYGKKEDAGYLHQQLEAQSKKDVEVEVEDEDEEEEHEVDSAPSAPPPPPPIIANAAPTSSPPTPLDPPLRPSPPSSDPSQATPARPPNPPPSRRAPPPPPSSPKPPQGAKRQHSPSGRLPRKQFKPNPARCILDWQCRKCQTWNWSFKVHCHGTKKNGRKCDYRRIWSDDIKEQAAAPGLTHRWTPAKTRGDWLCKCMAWNRSHWYRCAKCPGTADGKIGVDFNPELPDGIDPTPSMPASADYWGGGSSSYSTSVQHGYEKASHLGVLGKKKHSWEKKG